MKKYTKTEADTLISELMDTQRVQLVCSKHHYVAGGHKPPADGCKECMQCFWLHILAKTSPADRQAKLERMIELVKGLNARAERGELKDLITYRRPKVKIDKDAVPDSELVN